ncbi:MAG: thiamine pyrophosphate-binding protein [Pirellulaceae bacterium]|nr:thiamine pyrophosphate-binding protein [Pirellulaceae bacterium]
MSAETSLNTSVAPSIAPNVFVNDRCARKASDFIADYLEARGVPCVFEMAGGMIAHILDSLSRKERVSIISTHHEQAAAFAAEAFGRMTGTPGVAFATSGPGATNLLTGIGSCYFDSSPAVFITGQVNRHEMKGDRGIRQLGFQETDIVSVAQPLTKAAWLIHKPELLPSMLDNAFSLAMLGRPGPVLLDIPMDVQREVIRVPEPSNGKNRSSPRTGSLDREAAAVVTGLAKAERPLILGGGGIHSARALAGFRDFVRNSRIPVVNSLPGVDLLPYGHPLRVGMIGSYGNRWANKALAEADCLLVLGSRLDVRQTGADTTSFRGDRVIYHVDCEQGEINNRVIGCRPILAELSTFLEAANRVVSEVDLSDHWEWRAEIEELRHRWPDIAELPDIKGINPNALMHLLSRHSREAVAYAVDVGQHQMWAGQSLELHAGQRFLTSGGMGSMGFALPAAIGASHACGKRPVVVIAGDGGFQCNIQELQTVVRNQVPLKIVVLNNRCHGMVRQFQESYFERRYQSTMWGYSAPDFARVAAAYGISSRTVEDAQALDDALANLWQDPGSPGLLQVMIDPQANAYPKLAFGRPISEMEPHARPLEIEST